MMKRFLTFLIVFLFSFQLINAESITITLSNGRTFVVDSDDFETTKDLLEYVQMLEALYGTKPYVPGIGQSQG